MNEIKYAPVIIPTLCRHEHFKNEIESLKKNGWAKYTDVYIALDYPAKDEHWDGYKKICEYLDSGDFSVFKSFTVFKREKNYGVVDNSRDLKDRVSKLYDRWITAEDDLIFSPNFLEYMDKCLAEYEDDDDVMAVNGYSYPLDWQCDKNKNVVFQSTVCLAWGIGWWRKKWNSMKSDVESGYIVENFDMCRKTGLLKKLIKSERYTYIFESLLGKETSFLLAPTDTAYDVYMMLKNKCVVMPTMSKVRNCGYDGSGTWCPKIKKFDNKHSLSYDYNNQPIDMSSGFEICADSVKCRAANRNLLDNFRHLPRGYIQAARLLFMIYRLLGVNGYKAVISRVSLCVNKLISDNKRLSKYSIYFKNPTFKYLNKYSGIK